MVDRIKDSQGNYVATTYDGLKSFIDQAVQERLAQLQQEDDHRSLRFKSDAEKHRELYTLHLNDKPDLAARENKEALRRWNQELLALERSAQTAERQYTIHLKAMQQPNMDLLKRQARRHVSERDPDIYTAYQSARETRRVEKLWDDLATASEKLDTLINEGAATRHISPTARKIERLVTSLEKSKDFDKKTTDIQQQKLSTAKTTAREFLESTGKGHGWENG